MPTETEVQCLLLALQKKISKHEEFCSWLGLSGLQQDSSGIQLSVAFQQTAEKRVISVNQYIPGKRCLQEWN